MFNTKRGFLYSLNVMCSDKYKNGNNKNFVTNITHLTLIWK